MNKNLSTEMVESYQTMKDLNDFKLATTRKRDKIINLLSDINQKLDTIAINAIEDIDEIKEDCKGIRNMITDLYWN